MAIKITSVTVIHTSDPAITNVTFDILNTVGSITQTLTTLSLNLEGLYSYEDPTLIPQITEKLVGSPWQQ